MTESDFSKFQAFTVNDSEKVCGGICFLASGCDGSVFR